MIRILFVLVPILLLGAAFAWLAERPGEVTLVFGGYEYQFSLMVAAFLIAGAAAAVMIVWWVLKGLWNSPHAIAHYFRTRRRDRGYAALSTGLIAAGSGDAMLARRKKKEALQLLDGRREPLIYLLDAQASLLEGDHDGARTKFEAMLDEPSTRLLGLRGLYLEAERAGDRTAARHYAERAAENAPQLGWASAAALEEKSDEGDWDGALKLVDMQKSTRQIDRDLANRRRAVLLAGKAMELLDAEPVQARNAALEAHRLAPDLVPAAVVAAKAAFRLDDLRKGTKVLEAVWRRVPHPDIADAYVHARLGDSTQDRLIRAKRLQSLKQNHPESALAVARAALAAGDYQLARSSVEAAIRQEPREGAYLLLADIEVAESGDQGRARQWLAKAVRAPRDPAWVADGYVADKWAPTSPITGRLDAFEWRPPVERLGQVIEAGDDALALSLPGPHDRDDPATEDISQSEEADRPATVIIQPEAASTEPVSAPVTGEEPVSPDGGATANGSSEPEPQSAPVAPDASKAPARSAEAASSPAHPPADPPGNEAIADFEGIPAPDEPEQRVPRLPDDPGVNGAKAEAKDSRFKLF